MDDSTSYTDEENEIIEGLTSQKETVLELIKTGELDSKVFIEFIDVIGVTLKAGIGETIAMEYMNEIADAIVSSDLSKDVKTSIGAELIRYEEDLNAIMNAAVEAIEESSNDIDDDEDTSTADDDNTGLYIAIALVVAVGLGLLVYKLTEGDDIHIISNADFMSM